MTREEHKVRLSFNMGYDLEPSQNLHELKTIDPYFEAVWHNEKPFEVRKADRNFRYGDVLWLREWDQTKEEFTGRSCYVEITFILQGGQFGIEPGYVVLGLKSCFEFPF